MCEILQHLFVTAGWGAWWFQGALATAASTPQLEGDRNVHPSLKYLHIFRKEGHLYPKLIFSGLILHSRIWRRMTEKQFWTERWQAFFFPPQEHKILAYIHNMWVKWRAKDQKTATSISWCIKASKLVSQGPWLIEKKTPKNQGL